MIYFYLILNIVLIFALLKYYFRHIPVGLMYQSVLVIAPITCFFIGMLLLSMSYWILLVAFFVGLILIFMDKMRYMDRFFFILACSCGLMIGHHLFYQPLLMTALIVIILVNWDSKQTTFFDYTLIIIYDSKVEAVIQEAIFSLQGEVVARKQLKKHNKIFFTAPLNILRYKQVKQLKQVNGILKIRLKSSFWPIIEKKNDKLGGA